MKVFEFDREAKSMTVLMHNRSLQGQVAFIEKRPQLPCGSRHIIVHASSLHSFLIPHAAQTGKGARSNPRHQLLGADKEDAAGTCTAWECPSVQPLPHHPIYANPHVQDPRPPSSPHCPPPCPRAPRTQPRGAHAGPRRHQRGSASPGRQGAHPAGAGRASEPRPPPGQPCAAGPRSGWTGAAAGARPAGLWT